MAITPAPNRDTGRKKHQCSDEHHELGERDESSVIVTAARQITRYYVDRDDCDAQDSHNRNELPPARDVARGDRRTRTGQHRKSNHGPCTPRHFARYVQAGSTDRTSRRG